MKKIITYMTLCLVCLSAHAQNGMNQIKSPVKKIPDITISRTIDTTLLIRRNMYLTTDTASNPYLLKSKGAAADKADVMPQYPGGQAELVKKLRKNIKYPQKAIDRNISGTVKAQFIVNADGSLGRVGVNQEISPLLAESVVGAINKCTGWAAGITAGKPSRVRYEFNVEFVLESTMDKRVDNLYSMENKLKTGLANEKDAKRYFELFPHSAIEMNAVFGYLPGTSNIWSPNEYWITEYFKLQQNGYVSTEQFLEQSLHISQGLKEDPDLIGLYLKTLKTFIDGNLDMLAPVVSKFNTDMQKQFWTIATANRTSKEIKTLNKLYHFQ